ncbi:MAG: BREX-1 system adenine-specific DNA-methyltransferase PglX [Gemmataceae bacterium]|nr:BREX-1 system adenine-specific DNA-methyltransferase PglX [Gemmataceae bacterium]
MLAKRWKETPFAIRYSLFAQHAILSIRVLDPACGSGHFLLAAARRLGKELARIRTGEDEPSPDAIREAVREVIAHCIYGVDKNPLAVELCKVALWIESCAPGKPLTFLDHRIRCGDSLVGVCDLTVLRQGIPEDAFEPTSTDDKSAAKQLKKRNRDELRDRQRGQFWLSYDVQADLEDLSAEARALDAIPDDTPERIREKERQFQELQLKAARDRTACHLWTGAFFQPLCSGEPAITSRDLFDYLEGRPSQGQVLGRAEGLAVRHRFFHWVLEFPEVFVDGGFDVVLGNPPFMGGLKISGALGDRYRHWLEVAYDPYGGTADLCAAFFRRAFALLRPGGRLGMIATNTLGQGDTRESGLKVILAQGGRIAFAQRFVKWPGQANVEVNLVVLSRPAALPLSSSPALPLSSSPVLDGHPVPSISSRLDAEPEAEPTRLKQNEGKAFQGDIVRGIGFVLEPGEAEALIAKDPRNADCLFPYLNGEDLNSHPEQQPSRWVICFHDWDLERVRQYPDLLRMVEERVRPERERLTGPGDKRNREYWWQFGAYRAGMRRAIAPLRRVLVRSRVSELHAMVFVPPGWIYNEQLIVFGFDDDYHFALLQSGVHEVWLRQQASSLRTDIRYTPTDCFDTFPFPPLEMESMRTREGESMRVEEMPQAFQQAAQVGAAYHEHRRQVMLSRQLGLTKTYNLFHNPACQDADILRLRELHAEMDRAILACYGWQDLDLRHDFYQNERGQVRFMPSESARRELIVRLMALNERMAEEENASR